jgi:hypothetical protein
VTFDFGYNAMPFAVFFLVSCPIAMNQWGVMSIDQFETWSLYLGVGGLIGFMLFIVWDLAQKSKAGKFGTFILFLALGLGLLGFIVKTVLVELLE